MEAAIRSIEGNSSTPTAERERGRTRPILVALLLGAAFAIAFAAAGRCAPPLEPLRAGLTDGAPGAK